MQNATVEPYERKQVVQRVVDEPSTDDWFYECLSCGVSRIRCVLMVMRRGGNGRLVHDTPFLRWICFEHDASLGSFGAKWTRHGHGLAGCGEALRVVWTAHEEQRVDGVFFCLLARHAEDACTGGLWGGRTCARVAVVFPLGGAN